VSERSQREEASSGQESPSGQEASRRKETSSGREASTGNGRSALLIDWGGVLTTNLFTSFHEYCVRMQIDSEQLVASFRSNPDFRELLIALEKGTIAEPEFERRFAEILGVDSDGLIDGLFAGVQPDVAMVQAVRAAHDAGIKTALVSNSWGVHRYPHDLFSDIFDGIVISGEVGTRKPAKRMYELGAERAGAQLHECVFVDDLPFNLTPAEELGMATVHHTSAETTIPQLERLLAVQLSVS
jgi:epoxide hydrolase-like predicted phosphatase